MASHVSQCMAKSCHVSTCMALLKPIYMGSQIQLVGGGGGGAASLSPWEQQGEGGGREKRKGGKEKRKGGKEKRNGGKEKKRKKENRKRKECRAVSRPGRRRTQNCATKGRFPPTLVILRLGAV